MGKVIKLNLNMNKSTPITHPLLDDAKIYTNETINAYARFAVNNAAYREDFFFSLKACVKNTVGRYIYYYPETKAFLDDMVSEAFFVVSKFVNEISLDMVEKYDILNIVQGRIKSRLETYLNRNYYIVTSGMKTHRNRFKNGEEALCYSSCDLCVDPLDDGDEWKRDLLDTLNHIAKDHIDEYILKQENWGRTYQSLADDLKVGVGTIHRRKVRLYNRYVSR